MSEDKVLNKLPTDLEVVVPKKGVITKEDLQKWMNNVVTFMSVPLIAFLTAVSTGVDPRTAFNIALVPALINALIDLLKKRQSDTPYLREK